MSRTSVLMHNYCSALQLTIQTKCWSSFLQTPSKEWSRISRFLHYCGLLLLFGSPLIWSWQQPWVPCELVRGLDIAHSPSLAGGYLWKTISNDSKRLTVCKYLGALLPIKTKALTTIRRMKRVRRLIQTIVCADLRFLPHIGSLDTFQWRYDFLNLVWYHWN